MVMGAALEPTRGEATSQEGSLGGEPRKESTGKQDRSIIQCTPISSVRTSHPQEVLWSGRRSGYFARPCLLSSQDLNYNVEDLIGFLNRLFVRLSSRELKSKCIEALLCLGMISWGARGARQNLSVFVRKALSDCLPRRGLHVGLHDFGL
jgi:hypothetical protein